MFQLIVAVISIALVAALAIASIFYGGEAFSKSSEKANVTALINQAQQISGAYQLYKTDTGTPPDDIADLTTGGYLASAPTPSKIANGAAWTIVPANGTVPASVTILLNSGNVQAGTVCTEVLNQAGNSIDPISLVGAQFGCAPGADPLTNPSSFVFRL